VCNITSKYSGKGKQCSNFVLRNVISCIILSIRNTEMYNHTSMHFVFTRTITCETLTGSGTEHVYERAERDLKTHNGHIISNRFVHCITLHCISWIQS
jgi:hypothetical protein